MYSTQKTPQRGVFFIFILYLCHVCMGEGFARVVSFRKVQTHNQL